MKGFLHIVLSLLICSTSFSQLTTTVQTPTHLVNNVLLGDPGITVSNITYQGHPNAIGSFNATGTNLGINSGIILTTGTILNNNEGPLGPNNKSDAGVDNGTPGYALLTNIVGTSTHNATVLAFDFQTCSDSIEFKYVFGSEEYPEYVGSQYNDVFGFFISGPGFSGMQNIARLPNGSVVAINSVNNGNSSPAFGVPVTGPSNPQYFVPNGNGSQSPFNSSNIYIQYDGFTRVLTAKAKVECNAKYRLTLAIADVGDGVYDSGIFIEANSFKANDPLKISHQLTNDAFNNPNQIAEPCAAAKVRLTRTNCNVSSPLNISVSTSGTAISGVDYQPVPSVVTIPTGELYAEFDLTPIYDVLNEGTENVILHFNYLDNCGDTRNQELELFIRDIDPMDFTLSSPTPICPGDDVVITSNVTGGGGLYSYQWSTGETTPNIVVNPTVTSSYTLIVRDDCINQDVVKSITVMVPTYTPLSISGVSNIVELCPYQPTDLSVIPSGGFGDYTYQWMNENWEIIGKDSIQNVAPRNTTNFNVVVTDKCGLKDTFKIEFEVLTPPLIIDLDPFVEICPGDSILLTPIVSLGYGNYYYEWLHSGETTQSVWVNPYVTTTYTVKVSDECQTYYVQESTQVIVIKPTANFEMITNIPFNNIDLTFQNLSINASSYIWDFGDGGASTLVHPNHYYFNPGDYLVSLIAIDDKGCKDTIVKNIHIIEEYYIYVPNTFTPDEGRYNNYFKAVTLNIEQLEIQIFNRWGELVFESDDVNFSWDGYHKDKPVIDGTYTYKIAYTARNTLSGKLKGHVNVLR